ncbi:ABC transporter substrate-binding protein [Murimonas intestini]|uniref:ABC transporter substrate-binding protein n=1 Tax=Murimonas intestini TaxID=1337051 RepID=UPI0011DD1E04|nr:ABC transporter substrate-binding protein [Murimonas intestini]
MKDRKNNWKKWTAGAAALFVLAGFGSDTVSAKEPPVTVNLLMFGEESARMQELMEDEIQQRVLDEINVDLQISYLPWSEYGTGKSEMMFSTGEKFMCYTNTEITAHMAGKGYYADVTDVLEENAPQLYEYCDEANAARAFEIDGRVYAVPVGYKENAGEDYLIMVRRDLMDEAGFSGISTLEELERFYSTCKELHPDYIGLGGKMNPRILNGVIASDKNMEFINNFIMTDANHPEDTALYSYYESTEFKQVCEITSRWKEMGIIPEYLLYNAIQSENESDVGHSMFAVSSCDRIFEMMEKVRLSVPDAVFENIYLGDVKEKPLIDWGGTYVTAFAVSAGVKDEDELAAYVKVINLFQKNQEWVDLWTHGIEGTDYTLTPQGRVKRLCSDGLINSWMTVNPVFRRFPDYVTDEQIETYYASSEGSIPKKTRHFIFNTGPVNMEYAQLQAIEAEYLLPIALGFQDYDENIAGAIDKLKQAGIDEVLSEAQRQFDEFKKQQQE